MDEAKTIHLSVPPEDDGRPLRELVAAALGGAAAAELLIARGGLWVDERRTQDLHLPVSYTHLTLPTIYSV